VDLDEVRKHAHELSPWAHLATVGSDGEPDVVPIHPCWEGEVIWAMVGRTSVKARNLLAEERVALHWQVTEKGDGLEVWGTGSVLDDLDTKRRLWNGVFDYDLNMFAPGGPEQSPDTAFMRVVPVRAMYLKSYGMAGVERWSAAG
jgi:general stress protein 26